MNPTFSKFYARSLSILFMILGATLLSQCSSSVDEELVIPDNYIGTLVLQFNCPGGRPLEYKDGLMRVEFQNDGFACTSDITAPSIVTFGKGHSHTKSGKAVSYASMVPLSKKEFALCYSASGRRGESGVVVNFHEWWYGSCREVNSKKIHADQRDFFKRRYGFAQ
jgi:hypothetical protein